MKIFICDGTPESFFTAVFDAYLETDCVITSDETIQLTIGDEPLRVPCDAEKCDRVRCVLKKYGAETDVLAALKSCDTRKEQICFKYIKKLTELKKPIKNAFNLPEVVDFNDILYKITGETHRLKGLLRFKETAGGVLYAPYSPDNDITVLLMPHFAARLRSEKFIIHDVKRGIAGLYDGLSWLITSVGEAGICLSDSERTFESLWKKYYKAVNIESRPHEKQMKRSMPVRYWKFLPEKND